MSRHPGTPLAQGDTRTKVSAGTPIHVAVIMDGNGRWAQRRGLARVEGHRRGAEAVRETIAGAIECDVRYLTLYAFSTENWKRPRSEVDVLMSLMLRHVQAKTDDLKKRNIRVSFIGHRTKLPAEVTAAIDMVETQTSANDGLRLTVGLNYSGRSELVWMIQRLIEDAVAGRTDPDQLDEAALSQRLMTAGVPDPDLVIRTGGEHRLSNFLLWQVAYSELYFSSVLWPDFTQKDFRDAVAAYRCRRRRFGGIDA